MRSGMPSRDAMGDLEGSQEMDVRSSEGAVSLGEGV